MNATTITDIRIPFWRLTGIILKFMLASIPAVLLLYFIVFVLSLALMALFGGLIAGTGILEDLADPSGVSELLEKPAEPNQ